MHTPVKIVYGTVPDISLNETFGSQYTHLTNVKTKLQGNNVRTDSFFDLFSEDSLSKNKLSYQSSRSELN